MSKLQALKREGLTSVIECLLFNHCWNCPKMAMVLGCVNHIPGTFTSTAMSMNDIDVLEGSVQSCKLRTGNY